MKDNLSLSDVYGQLLSYEAHLTQQASEGGQFYSSANVTARGRGRGEPRILDKGIQNFQMMIFSGLNSTKN